MANTVYNNKVIEAKAKDLLLTKVNARSMMTIDTSLTQNAGMVKTINTYTYTGAAEEVAAGSGNTTRGSVAYVGKDYTVKMIQQAFDYLDEDFMKDPNVVEMGVQGATQVMSNKMTTDFYAALADKAGGSTELVKGITFAKGKALSYDVIVDAISELNVEDESKIFIVIPNAWKAALRKDADYKSAMMGEIIYNGQVGTICGIPVIATKALTDTAYVLTPEAIKLFMKKDVEVEQDRDVETKTNTVVLTTYYICALVNQNKICKIVKG